MNTCQCARTTDVVLNAFAGGDKLPNNCPGISTSSRADAILVGTRYPEGTVQMLRFRSQPRNGHQAIAGHQPDTAPLPPTPASGHASNTSAVPRLVAQQPPSRRTGEQENPQQRNCPSSLDQTHPHTGKKKEAKPLKPPQIVARIENHRKAQFPRPNSACPKKLGQPHPIPCRRTLSTVMGRRFPDRAVWVWKSWADRWTRIFGSA